jgi:hypothetical protein
VKESLFLSNYGDARQMIFVYLDTTNNNYMGLTLFMASAEKSPVTPSQIRAGRALLY